MAQIFIFTNQITSTVFYYGDLDDLAIIVSTSIILPSLHSGHRFRLTPVNS
ncbi:MAG: hypothetical protein HYS25_00030 [Ignavibacteriales bacterium]|nr:hypothetical protein [Ignavibacteriales bacterium]